MAAYTTIDNPELYFQTKLWTGTGSTNALTLDGSENMQPDFVWIKLRAGAADYGHRIFDSVRGATKTLNSAATSAEGTEANSLSAFSSDGFTVVDADEVNQSGGSHTYVAWCWKESATAGFDMVAHTGTGSTHTISHSLSAKPHMIINKGRSDAHQWMVQHHSLGATMSLILEGTAAQDDSATQWNDTEPTSSVFTVGTNGQLNTADATYITYLFTSIQGFSKFGVYRGNGNDDGPFVNLGFRPAFIIIKKTDATNAWSMLDSTRDTANPLDNLLWANVTDAEDGYSSTATARYDFLSNGFKCVTDGSAFNTSGSNYIYMAFAEAPFVNSNGVPCNAR